MIRVDRLIWDEGNTAHIARHDVTPKEVEEVCHGQYLVKDAKAGRVMIIGSTKSGRALCIIIDPEAEERIWYPVTARPADKAERKKYTQETGVIL